MSGLLILGAGGLGKVIAEIAVLMGKWERIAFLDDRVELKEVMGFPVIGKLTDLDSYIKDYNNAFVAIGHNHTRLMWLQLIGISGFIIPALIHPLSIVSKFSSIGEGTAVMAGAVINTDATIGRGCIINTCASIDHDCTLEDGIHVSPGARVSGTVNIGRCSWVCVGSTIANDIRIGSHVIVAAGAVVVRNVPDNVMVAGVPAMLKKVIAVRN
ncbi:MULTISPECIES: NeuD/PglB/VioB family sugar acetyltransferase [Paenibacillus]|uniref:NeuD/PglB/VioB family sugar acetyltransferase n=1 Tax=Paenibacillus radicis (ex Xue et al. 2023) TaxID=2972489 RepID=A0ABT1YTS0_9BACL|nr:NeuD/PglB/VioB family sugar acetyltransferase [Paenibacillus radicis (ex Xue et al. 2023)]MCR8635385.1 NeuD/PglB/VioB family sugar acetyltransferase [Paenibacillus radicis (ex Xue et al. 2023)]